MIHRGYRFKLNPTDEQSASFAQFAGICRLAYNLALEQRRDHWRLFKANTGNNISYPSQARELTLLRAEYDWIGAVHVTPQQQALRDLDRAYQNFFKGIAKYPSPRKKGLNDTFRFQGREVKTRKLNGKWSEVRLPKIGWVRFRDTRALVGKVNNATISLAANGWHISFSLAIEHDAPAAPLPTSVGIDRGVAQTLALSTGELMAMPSSLAEPGRMVRQKAGLNRSILNQGWHIFETLLSYKLEERGGHLCKVPAHYTSQTCSECGAVDRQSRENQASFVCRHCGHRANADHNAAINILRRNTSSMVVEDGHWFSVEATTGVRAGPSENPLP